MNLRRCLLQVGGQSLIALGLQICRHNFGEGRLQCGMGGCMALSAVCVWHAGWCTCCWLAGWGAL